MAQDEEDDSGEGEGGAQANEKAGFVKKLFGNKKLVLVIGAVLLLAVLGGGAAVFLLGGESAPEGGHSEESIPTEPPNIVYADLPDLLVNIQTSEGASAYLKVSLSLELNSEQEKAGIEALTPRIVDQLQGYLREVRVDDLKGSSGVMRLKEELLRRVLVAAAPYRVRDVLLKEMVVQ